MAKKKREEKAEGGSPRLLISFGYSRSPNYAEAVRVARSLAGYGRRGSGKAVRHTVEQELHLADGQGVATVRYLHRLVESWKGSRVELSGCQEKHFRHAEYALEAVSRCYEQQQSKWIG